MDKNCNFTNSFLKEEERLKEELMHSTSETSETSETDEAAPKAVMLTTIDNPYNPHTHFDEWRAFDEAKGYYTCSYLSRIAVTSDELTEEDEAKAINDAIDEIIKYNLLGIYKKVTA